MLFLGTTIPHFFSFLFEKMTALVNWGYFSRPYTRHCTQCNTILRAAFNQFIRLFWHTTYSYPSLINTLTVATAPYIISLSEDKRYRKFSLCAQTIDYRKNNDTESALETSYKSYKEETSPVKLDWPIPLNGNSEIDHPNRPNSSLIPLDLSLTASKKVFSCNSFRIGFVN